MGAISTITIADSVPTNHVFTPVRTTPTAVYRDVSDAAVTTIGQDRIEISMVDKTMESDGISKVKVSIIRPIEETFDGDGAGGYVAPPKVAFYNRMDMILFVPTRSIPQHRIDIVALAKSLLSNSQVTDAFHSLITPY